jgi:hypothetical protein
MVIKKNMLIGLRNKSRLCVTFFMLVVLGLSVGCSRKPDWNEAQRTALEQRVRLRWQALEARDFNKAWEFSSPNYRAIFPKQLYVRNFSYAVEWELTGVEILNYDSDAAVASVVARVMSKPTKQTSSASVMLGTIPTYLRERWIFAEGQWWFSANY